MKKKIAIMGVALFAAQASASVLNGGFEDPVVPNNFWQQVDEGNVPGWNTTAGDNLIEIWDDGFNGIGALEGAQFAEINATQTATLFQSFATNVTGPAVLSFGHRGRDGDDTMKLTITDTDSSTVLFTGDYTSGKDIWSWYATDPFSASNILIEFEAIREASGNASKGNFIDDIQISAVPIPAAVWLLGSGILGLVVTGRKKSDS